VETGGDRGDPAAGGQPDGGGGSAVYTVETEEDVTTLQVSFGLSRSRFTPGKQALTATKTGFNPNLSDGSNTSIHVDDPSIPHGGASV